jgi:geranylgeranylglycerol-phosphate geranylgeranyltransferase
MRSAASTRIWALIAFLRPQIAFQAVLYAAIGMYLSGVTTIALNAQQALALLVLALIVSFGFVINDYLDLSIDRLTKPERFLPSGSVTLQAARLLGIVLVGLVLILAGLLPAPLRWIAYLNLLLTAAYSLWLKRTVLLGNSAIAFLNSSILLYGAIMGNGANRVVWSVITIVVLYTLAQEVLYTVDDYAGDAQAGITTTAVYLGVDPTLTIFKLLISAAALSSFVPVVLGFASIAYILLLIPCLLGPIFLRILPLVNQSGTQQISNACKTMKLVRVSSLAPLLVLPL